MPLRLYLVMVMAILGNSLTSYPKPRKLAISDARFVPWHATHGLCVTMNCAHPAALRHRLLVQAAVAGLRADADAAEQSLELALDEARQGHTEASMRAEAAETARYSFTAFEDAGTLAKPSAGPACGF